MHTMSPGFLSLTGIGLNSQLSLEQLGSLGCFFMRTVGIMLKKKNEVMSLDNSWSQNSFVSLCSCKPSMMANVLSTSSTLDWQTHQSSRPYFSFVYLHKFPYGMENQ